LDSSVWLEFTQDKSLMEKKIFLENWGGPAVQERISNYRLGDPSGHFPR
jgi:hypothetical protein